MRSKRKFRDKAWKMCIRDIQRLHVMHWSWNCVIHHTHGICLWIWTLDATSMRLVQRGPIWEGGDGPMSHVWRRVGSGQGCTVRSNELWLINGHIGTPLVDRMIHRYDWIHNLQSTNGCQVVSLYSTGILSCFFFKKSIIKTILFPRGLYYAKNMF